MFDLKMEQIRHSGRLLVTGAGGFVGGHLLHALQDDPAWTVVAATRDGRDGSRRLDLTDHATLGSALMGVDAVVHCAVGNRAVTVDGTRALLQAARLNGVRRFVHISSVAVYGQATGAVDETTAMQADGRGYPGWKAAAERACLAQDGMEVVRLRPAIVYGPGSALWVSTLAARIEGGRWGSFGRAGEGSCNLVHVQDVARAITLALSVPGVGGRAFNISGDEPMSWNSWFSRMAEALGAGPLPRVRPASLWARCIASLPVKAVARVRPGFARDWLLGAPAIGEMRLFAHQATYPTMAAESALGWQPRVGVAEGLAECVRWLRRP